VGKTTLYHPIPLSVIRGAAEYCGFKFAKIHQLHCFPDTGSARYNVEIVAFPKGWNKQPHDIMQNVLQSCFMDDIRVRWLRLNRKDQWMIHLQVNLKNYAETDDEKLSEQYQRGDQ
jgi:hypothetical protein